MPARDGSGPLGKGSGTGRGAGKCAPGDRVPKEATSPIRGKPMGWGGRVWNTTFGRLFKRRRANRIN